VILLRVGLVLAAIAGRGWIAAAEGQTLTITPGKKGEISSVRSGDTVFFRDAALRIARPGWSGMIAEQINLDTADVRMETDRGASVYRFTLKGAEGSFAVRQTIKRTANTAQVVYEVTPKQAIQIEALLFSARMPAEGHAGRTRYFGVEHGVSATMCPTEVRQNDHVLIGAGSTPSIGFIVPGNAALRVGAIDAILQFQDDRKWGMPGYELFASAGNGALAAGQTIRFGMTFTAMTASALEDEMRGFAMASFRGITMTDHRPLHLSNVRASAKQLATYETVEVRASVGATYDNPFDPRQIRFDGEVTTPSGERLVIPGFYRVPGSVVREGGGERVVVGGKPEFAVRYTPSAPGRYSLRVVARNGERSVAGPPITFVVAKGERAGFIRRSATDRYGFSREVGAAGEPMRPLVAIGQNLCWANGPAPIATYDQWLTGMGKAGHNWARLWLAFNEKGMEWMPAPTPKAGVGSYRGLGRYAQDNAYRLDEVVRLAQKHEVNIVLCIGTYGEFTEGGFFNEGSWQSNPYNAANGGPCGTPAEFWTNPEARRLYKQRLRYLIGRYAHAANLFAWEFWNEVPPTPEQEKWVAEMAAYVRALDPYKHLISTTYGSPGVWECPDIDFTMSHTYGQGDSTADFTSRIVSDTRAYRLFGKPYILAEFGIDWQSPDSKWDPKGTGINVHNGAWAALMAGGAGTAMVWWWDSYIHPHNLYPLLTPIRRYADRIPRERGSYEPLDGIEVHSDPGGSETFKDCTVSGGIEWGMPPSTIYTVRPDGTVEGGPIAMSIGSPNRSKKLELPTELTWKLDLQHPTRITFRLGQVCQGATMVIRVDGRTALQRRLDAGEPGKGPWKAARKLEEYNVWVSDYDEDISFELSSGPHTITVSNTAGDWFQIRSLTIPRYQSSRYPDVNALGLVGTDALLLWFHNRESVWKTAFNGRSPGVLRGLTAAAPVRVDGAWAVEWWDTWTGSVVRRESVEARSGVLKLRLPDLATDIAAIARPPSSGADKPER